MQKSGRYTVVTHLTPDEYDLLKRALAKTGLSEYRLLKDALCSHCNSCLAEVKEKDEREGRTANSKRDRQANRRPDTRSDEEGDGTGEGFRKVLEQLRAKKPV